MKQQMKQEIKIFGWTPRALIKGWCFCCYKYRRGIQRFISIIKKEQTKQDRYLNETNEKSTTCKI